MILFNPKAKLRHGSARVAPEILFAINVAEKIFENYGLSVNVVALLEGHTHSHFLGREVDFSVTPEQAKDIVADLQTALLDSFVIRDENNIIHVVFP